MSGLINLNNRISFRGGDTQGRFIKDKAKTLKNALHNSYQGQTAILEDKREFKCLINPDKEHFDYTRQIISIPFDDTCINSAKYERIGMKPGDTFTWKETNTHWMVTLQHLNEVAYFMGELQQCDQQVEIGDKKYWTYIRGPVETKINWNQKSGIEWNDLNYSLIMYITCDDNTIDYFRRFGKVKITNPQTNKTNTWQVVSHNDYYGQGIIKVCLLEDFENSMQDAVNKHKPPEPIIPEGAPKITGPKEAYQYDTVKYIAENFATTGCWHIIEQDKDIKTNVTAKVLTLDIKKSKGEFSVKYVSDSEEASLQVKYSSI